MRTSLLAPLGALLIAHAAPAQQPPLTQPLDSGAVVRLRLGNGSLEGARLLAPFARDSAAFTYCPWPAPTCAKGSERQVVRLSREVLGIEVHRGTAWKAGAVLGALFGVPMGLQFAQWRYTDDEGGGERVTPQQKIRTVLVTSAVFALFGAMFGEFFQLWGPAP
ncbi:MAG: hypothetical protein ABSB58_02685 [Gemmatimonadales bacterium]|jgi:hypothetical protein